MMPFKYLDPVSAELAFLLLEFLSQENLVLLKLLKFLCFHFVRAELNVTWMPV